MGFGGHSIIFVVSSVPLGVLFFIFFIKFLHAFCWKPIYVQRLMRSQGIKGPSYRFLNIYGNTKEILKMKKESLSKPMEGLSHQLVQRIQPHIYSWIHQYGKSFIYWNGLNANFVTIETEYVKEILNNKDKCYPKHEIKGYLKKLIGGGLGTAEGEKWLKQRKLANHAFHSDNLKNMCPAMIASAEMMLAKWKEYDGKEIEVYQEFKFLTSEIISRTAFGSSYIEGKGIFEKLSKLCLMFARQTLEISLIPGLSRLCKTRDEIESEDLNQEIRESIIRIIRKRVKETVWEEIDCSGNDYLGLLLKAYNSSDESHKLNIDDIINECKTFYLAGQDTTATLLAWTFLLLGIHTDWQEKAREEVVDIFGRQQPNLDGLSRMKTMNMIINETLRLYPPAVGFTRIAEKEVKLAGKINLPPNTTLTISSLALHRDTQVWGEDALLFKPERFSEGVAKATKNNQAAFIPFGLGPRTCVGYNFAMNEAKIALSMVLQRYSFTLSPTYVHSPVTVLNLRPQHGVQVVLHPLLE